ncbi:MAG TPA: prolyl oligopeptidase family serine peptidase [Thermoanaerobaculia bacterium]|nr:prolyl oligopeptidase family serine peptidase [Thermoanaerobaculia bacterium]
MHFTHRQFVVAALLVLSLGCRKGAESKATADVPAPQYAPLSHFPPLGEAKRIAPGVLLHQVSLAHGEFPGRIWIYLPEKRTADPLGCVFIAPAGVPPFLGNGFGPDVDRQYNPEHIPYVEAGFAVVAYDVDGDLGTRDDATYEQVQAAAAAFKNSGGGMLNARHAIDYVTKMVPGIDPARLYSAGHSSAGRLSLLLAESDPRIAACIAYAPVTNPEKRAGEIAPDAVQYLDANLPGFRRFLQETSPLQQSAMLRCPTFLYHSEDDERIPISDSEAFVETLKKTNPNVTFVRGKRGDHYSSMIDEGVPRGIRWLKGLRAKS